MYNWRTWTPALRKEAMTLRRKRHVPWHSPPHAQGWSTHFLISAACFEHKPVIGFNLHRMAAFESDLLGVLDTLTDELFAWVVLPNHYHALVRTDEVVALLGALGALHGHTSHDWNGEENKRGRKTWHNAQERGIRSQAHFWATLNYVHNNPVKHRYVERWQDWPFSSAREYLSAVGRDEAARIWKEYPVREYGSKWDLD